MKKMVNQYRSRVVDSLLREKLGAVLIEGLKWCQDYYSGIVGAKCVVGI